MAYELYKKIISEDDYFTREGTDYSKLDPDARNVLYERYLLKVEVFNRDNFKCTAKDCPYCHNKKEPSKLTLHHVKFKKNGGDDDADNCISLCREFHDEYHKGSINLRVVKNKELPYYISGRLFKFRKNKKFFTKEKKKEMRQLRKSLELSVKKYKLTWEELVILLKFIEKQWNE